MAYYAALTSLSQTLKQIPQPYVQQIASLHDKVSRMLVMLRDLSQKNSLMIKDLEGKIRDASYEAEDIIDSNISRQAPSKSLNCEASSCFWEVISALCNMIPAIHPFERSVEFMDEDTNMESQGLEQIIYEFESILNDLSNKINAGRGEDLQPRNYGSVGSSKFPTSNESPPVGLDEDLMKLRRRLTGPTHFLDIISIVGMGGIGKTTLARRLYSDPLIQEYFHIRAWTVVSQEYNVREMLLGLLDSTMHKGDELRHMSMDQLSDVLYRRLWGRKYLIVLDDVWSTKVWDDFRKLFPDHGNGSQIILTTRMAGVARYANPSGYIHHMSLLSPEASWNMLREKVFGKEYCPIELENIGKRIANNCKGLPLLIDMIGGLLCEGKKSQDYWEYIADNVNSVNEIDGRFVEMLSSTYNSLPHHVKSCFLYMGVFPEGYVIFVSELIKLWIADGFIPLADKSLEEVAKDYLNDLIDGSFITVRKKKPNGEIKTCIVHDIWRDFCIRKAQDEKFVQIMNWEVHSFPPGRNNHRRVSIHSNIVGCPTDTDESYVRSLLCFCKPQSQLLSFTMSCKLLRVFYALTVRFYEFPIEIVELVHLRFLAFLCRGNNIPASISKLRNLQTIIVLSRQPIYLPPNIWEMTQLRHILFKESFLPADIIRKTPIVLENLQTLSGITSFRCTRQVMEMMPNLKKLGISYVYDVDTDWSYYEFNNFVRLHQLETLKCLFIPKLSPGDTPLQVNLAFPPNLKRLTLSGCRIPWEKMTVIGSLPNLKVLKLKDHAFEGPVWKPKEGEFKELIFLLIDMSFLEHWMANDSHFPELRHLSLSCCPKLREIPSAFRRMLKVEMIELYECSSSAVASAMQIQQWVWGHNYRRVHVNSGSDYHYSQQRKSLRKVHRVESAW